MSGPKSYSYTVDHAALAAAREHEQALSALRAAREAHARAVSEGKRVRTMWEQVDEVASHPGLTDTPASTEEIRQQTMELQRYVEAEQQRLAYQSRSAFTRSLAESAGLTGAAVHAADVLGEHEPSQAEAVAAARAELQEDTERILARLDPDAEVSPSLSGVVQSAASTDSGSRAELLLDALRQEVRRANERLEARRARSRRLQSMLATLAGLPGAEVQALCDELYGALRGPPRASEDLDALSDRVAEVQVRGTRALEQSHVAEALRRTLTELGYTVGPGFVTALQTEGVADVPDPRHEGYAVRIRAPGGAIGYNVVRGPATRPDQKARDAAVEHDWCSDVSRLEEVMHQEGIAMTRTVARPAGYLPVQVDEGLAAPPAAKRATRALKDRQAPR
ncbi:MAG: hypothetical protein H0V12_01675 [Chloroflexi bacterium]|nr:hypothetical protein [Chloroflexota bacterium]